MPLVNNQSDVNLAASNNEATDQNLKTDEDLYNSVNYGKMKNEKGNQLLELNVLCALHCFYAK